MKIKNILWDVTIDDLLNKIDINDVKVSPKLLSIPELTWIHMDYIERDDYLYDNYYGEPKKIANVIGLPNEIEIPDIINKDKLTQYIMDTYKHRILDGQVILPKTMQKSNITKINKNIPKNINDYKDISDDLENIEIER